MTVGPARSSGVGGCRAGCNLASDLADLPGFSGPDALAISQRVVDDLAERLLAALDARPAPRSPWLTAREAAAYARVSLKLVYRAIAAGRLRAARINGRRDVRLRSEWLDAWLLAESTPVEVRR